MKQKIKQLNTLQNLHGTTQININILIREITADLFNSVEDLCKRIPSAKIQIQGSSFIIVYDNYFIFEFLKNSYLLTINEDFVWFSSKEEMFASFFTHIKEKNPDTYQEYSKSQRKDKYKNII